jgi:hypothetical protein
MAPDSIGHLSILKQEFRIKMKLYDIPSIAASCENYTTCYD